METLTSILNHLNKVKVEAAEAKIKAEKASDEEAARLKAQLDEITDEQILQKDPQDLIKKEEREKKKREEKEAMEKEAKERLEKKEKERLEKEAKEKAKKDEKDKNGRIEKPEKQENNSFDGKLLLYGIFGLAALGLGLGFAFFSRKSVVKSPVVEATPEPKTRDFDIGNGHIIKISI